jgi:hypothetical protein
LRKVKTKIVMESQPLLSYPTASNVKVDMEKIDKGAKSIFETIYNVERDRWTIDNKLRITLKAKMERR